MKKQIKKESIVSLKKKISSLEQQLSNEKANSNWLASQETRETKAHDQTCFKLGAAREHLDMCFVMLALSGAINVVMMLHDIFTGCGTFWLVLYSFMIGTIIFGFKYLDEKFNESDNLL